MPPFPALGSTASLILTDRAAAATALETLRSELDRLDRTCSRFRADSELVRLNQSSGSAPLPVSALLLDAVEAALRAARITDGLVDPTQATALERAGYDRDFSRIAPDGPPICFIRGPAPGCSAVTVDRPAGTISLAPGTRLDLGATAKALGADRAARAIAERIGAGVLVSLGGDLAVAGPGPAGGWPVKVAVDHTATVDDRGPVVAVRDGGLATSSTGCRRWTRGDRVVHHLIDPRTSTPVEEYWHTVTVAAGSCLDANIASCAAVVMGRPAPAWLSERGLPARLLRESGCPGEHEVTVVAGWPTEQDPCS